MKKEAVGCGWNTGTASLQLGKERLFIFSCAKAKMLVVYKEKVKFYNSKLFTII